MVAAALGVAGGLIAGFFGKLFDSVWSWVFAVFMACPGIVLLIDLYTVVGASPNVAMAVLGVLSAPGFFWPVRTLTRAVRAELYVDAARVSGLPVWRIVGRHVLLAINGPVIILASFMAGAAMRVQAALQFLGLGNPAIRPEWHAVGRVQQRLHRAHRDALARPRPRSRVGIAGLAGRRVGRQCEQQLLSGNRHLPRGRHRA